MDIIAVQRQYKSSQMQRNIIAIIALSLLLIIGVQAIALAKQRRSVVLIPSHVSDGMVAYGARDTRYIEAIALDTIYALFNVSPGSMEYSRLVLERVSAAAQREEVMKIWEKSTEDYVMRKISTTFLPHKIEYQLVSDRAVITGDLRTFIGNTMVNRVEKQIAVFFTPEAGSYRVSGIQEITELEDE